MNKEKSQLLDTHLFRQEMKDVTPLRNRKTTDSRPPPAKSREPEPNHQAENFQRTSREPANGRTRVDTHVDSSHRKNGIQKRTLQKLKRGRFPVGEQLDLHHMTINNARMALLDFISNAQGKNFACVRVIHGKGLRSANGPRLKTMTREVLTGHPQVQAFTACKPSDGGAGATDILLKTR